MTTPPQLTDRRTLERFRTRARDEALFLHREAAAMIEERLSEVNKAFTRPAVVSGLPAFWAGALGWDVSVPDSEVIALAPGGHDLIVHALSLHWANDPVGQMIQCRRALAPDGLFIAVLFGGQTLTELREALSRAEIAVSDGLSPRVAPMGDIRDLGALLQRAGFALPVADTLALTASYPTARDLMRDLRRMGEGNALADRRRTIPPRRLFDLAEAHYRDTAARPDGRLTATFELAFLTGWAPADSQPRPLKPGSATARLADALGAREHPAGDAPPRRGD